jgi:BlaI family transcriptional regulator, penicillinase repressor
MKSSPSLPPLSPAEQALMDLIWKLQPVNVTDLLESVNRGRKEPIIRNTLQTQLKRLEAKGWLKCEESGPVRLYHSAVPERSGRSKVLSELKHRLFGGSGVTMVRCLMEDGGLSPKEIKELNTLIESFGKGGGK